MAAKDTLATLRRRAALPIQLQVTARPGQADLVAEHLAGRRRNGVQVDLTCAAGDKLSRLAQISGLGSLIEDVEVIPPSLEDLTATSARGDAA